MGKKLTVEEKQARKAGKLARFVQHYARKACSGLDPSMPPEKLDRLLHEDET